MDSTRFRSDKTYDCYKSYILRNNGVIIGRSLMLKVHSSRSELGLYCVKDSKVLLWSSYLREIIMVASWCWSELSSFLIQWTDSRLIYILRAIENMDIRTSLDASKFNLINKKLAYIKVWLMIVLGRFILCIIHKIYMKNNQSGPQYIIMTI